MERIFSKVQPLKILHIVVKEKEIKPGRVDFIEEKNFLQCSMLGLEKGRTFRPHKHLWKPGNAEIIAQESWVIIKGSVKCIYYDLDDTILAERTLKAGDASFTLEGGHNYLSLEDGTKVYEMKTGPYIGQKFDKEFII